MISKPGIISLKPTLYREVLPGIDLTYYGQGRQLEYDFRVSPHANPRQIRLGLDGEGWTARQTASGDLEIRGPEGSLRFASPVFPGETIRTEIWREGPGRAAFRARVVERDVIVLNNGRVEFTD